MRIISTIVLSIFCWTFGGAFEIAHAISNSQESRVNSQESSKAAKTLSNQSLVTNSQSPSIKRPEEKFGKDIEEIANILKDDKADYETKRRKIKNKKADIDASDIEIKKQFKATEDKIKDLPEVIKQRHRDFVKKYDDNLRELKTNLNDIDKAKTNNEKDLAQNKAKAFLEKVKPPKKHQALDPNKLPHRTEEPVFKEPRTRPEEFRKDSDQQFSSQPNSPNPSLAKRGTNADPDYPTLEKGGVGGFSGQSAKPIRVASNGSLSGLLSPDSQFTANDSRFTALRDFPEGSYQIALANPPTSADLAETIEVKFTPAVTAKAAELGNNPVKIYEWVRNNIEYVPTYGSIQGADMCLQTKLCNDFDTASLLIALLRASGIHARYVYGTIELPIEKVKNWVGGFTDSMEALRLLASGGVPTKGLVDGGVIKYARLEHVHIEAYVPYNQYRGAKNTGENKTWIPMDASYKEYEYTQGTDLFQVAGVDGQGLIDGVKAHSTYDENGATITSIDQTFINQKIQESSSRLDAYIQTNMPNATMPDLLGYRKIVVKDYGILLGSLPYKTVAVLSRYSAVPDNLRHAITFSAYDPNYYDLIETLSYQASLPELAGKRITLSYTAATDTDRAVISQYGDLSLVPVYLVNLKPVLRVNGSVVAEGPAIGLGSDLQFTIRFLNAKGISEEVQSILPVGGYHAITLNASSIAKSSIQNISTNYQVLLSTINSGQGSIYPDDLMGEMLHSVGALYFYEADALNKLTAKLVKVRTLRHPSAAITSTTLGVSYMFSIPLKVRVKGLNIDVKRDIESSVALAGDKNSVLAYRIQSGTNSSMMEHMIYENLFQIEGISAVKILQIANQQGIPIYQLTQNNSSQILPNLQVNSSVIGDIQNLLNAGQVVTIPKQNISYNGWSGIGYVTLDLNTGNGGYMIEGGSAGGDTAVDPNCSTNCTTIGQIFNGLLSGTILLAENEQITFTLSSGLKMLSRLGAVANLLGIGVGVINQLTTLANSSLSPEGVAMVTALIYGIAAIQALLVVIGAVGFFAPMGSVISTLVGAYISIIFNEMIPAIITTIELMENYNRQIPH